MVECEDGRATGHDLLEERNFGTLGERPDIMPQGETFEELKANLQEAYTLMTMDEPV